MKAISIKEQLNKIMCSVFEVPVTEITEDASIDNIENWDSLRHLMLILALEEDFEITIPDEEVGNLVNYKIIELTINELTK